jgi:hypothetical protein
MAGSAPVRFYTAGMSDRQSCERRVYRLATLLTGNPKLAAGVITVVVDAQPDLGRLDSAHMDRLTVLRSREIRAGVLRTPMIPDDLADALAKLPAQQREAWILAKVYQLPDRELARAMDCSLTATKRHLELADQSMRQQLGPELAEDGPQLLLRYSMTLDVPAFFRAQQRRRRIVRWLLSGLLLAILLSAAIVIWRWIIAAG